MTARRRAAAWVKNLVVLSLSLSLVACVSRRVEVAPLSTLMETTVRTPVKAHLTDGSTVVYDHGVTVRADGLHGPGRRYDVALANMSIVQVVPIAEVAGLERFINRINVTESTLMSVPAALGVMVAATFIAALILIGNAVSGK